MSKEEEKIITISSLFLDISMKLLLNLIKGTNNKFAFPYRQVHTYVIGNIPSKSVKEGNIFNNYLTIQDNISLYRKNNNTNFFDEVFTKLFNSYKQILYFFSSQL